MGKYALNTWYPIAWSRDITNNLVARRIVETDVVLYRNSRNHVVAHKDMCPHRMLPLSMGRLRGDAIECGYHGMTFDCSGTCVRIPGQRLLNPPPKIDTYPTYEQMGLVWIWMGDPTMADPSLIFDLPQYHDANWSAVEGDALELDCHYLNLADNLCDPSHVSFVHLSTLGTPAGEDVPVRMEMQDGHLVTWRWINNSPAIPLFQKFGNFSGNVDRWHYYHYYAPSIAIIDFGSAPTGTGAQEGNRSDCIQIYACHFMTPVDENKTIDHWLHVKNFHADEATNRALSAEFRKAFQEDKLILEAIHKNEQKHVNHTPVKLALDASPIKMRRMVADMIATETAPSMVPSTV